MTIDPGSNADQNPDISLDKGTTPEVPAPDAPAAPQQPYAQDPYAQQQQPYGQPQQYGQQAPAGYGYAPAQPTNTLAIVSLITSIIGFSLIGVITGHLALSQIKRTGAPGRGFALAGVIVGYAYIAFTLIFVLFTVIISLASAGAGSYSY